MERRARPRIDVLPGNLITAAALLVLIPVVGTAGYMIIEGWGFLDALYMTVIDDNDGRLPRGATA